MQTNPNDIIVLDGNAYLVDGENADHYTDTRESHMAKLSAYDGGSILVGERGTGEDGLMDLDTILSSLTDDQRASAHTAYLEMWKSVRS